MYAASKTLGPLDNTIGAGLLSYFFIDPKEELIVIQMSQLQPYSKLIMEKK